MAQIISAQSVKMKFTELAELPAAQIELAIEEAALEVDSTWGDLQVIGMLYMTAHILTVQSVHGQSGTGQQIQSESWGGVMSVTYAAGPSVSEMSISDLRSTHYGLRVLDFMGRLFPPVAII